VNSGAKVSVMVIAAMVSWVAAVTVSAYSCLTLTYGQEDVDVFHQHSSAEVVMCIYALSDHCTGATNTLMAA